MTRKGMVIIMRKNLNISDAELLVMDIVWKSDVSLSAYQIREKLSKQKSWERTTVLTLIKRLVEKGMLKQEKREVYYYSPAILEEDYKKEETRNFVSKLYKGKSKDLIAALVQDESLTKKDIEELRGFLNQK